MLLHTALFVLKYFAEAIHEIHVQVVETDVVDEWAMRIKEEEDRKAEIEQLQQEKRKLAEQFIADIDEEKKKRDELESEIRRVIDKSNELEKALEQETEHATGERELMRSRINELALEKERLLEEQRKLDSQSAEGWIE